MIKINGIESILEAIYLEEQLVSKTSQANIEVNPYSGVDYMVRKTVILTNHSCDREVVKKLLENKNNVISRVNTYGDDVKYCPYILRPNFNIVWNGEVLTCPDEIRGDHDKVIKWLGEIEYSIDKPFLSFPKIKGLERKLLLDSSHNLTALGWALHQVGINLRPEFRDMDLLKTKKIR